MNIFYSLDDLNLFKNCVKGNFYQRTFNRNIYIHIY